MTFQTIKHLLNNGDYNQADLELQSTTISDVEYKILKAQIMEKQGHYDSGLKMINECLTNLSEEKETDYYIIASTIKAAILERKGEYPVVFKLYEEINKKISKLSKNEKDELKEWILKLNNIVGMVYWQKGELKHAEKLFQDNLNRLQNTEEFYRFKGDTHNNLGLLQSVHGKIEKAFEYYQEAYRFYLKINYIFGIAATQSNLGNLYFKIGNLRLAEKYLKVGLDLFSKVQSNYDIAVILKNLAKLYTYQGNFQFAIQKVEESIDYWNKVGNSLQIGLGFQRLGTLSMKTAQYNQARNYFMTSLMKFNKIGNKKQILITYSKLLKLTLVLNDRDEAQNYLDKMYTLTQSENDEIIYNRLQVTYLFSKALFLKHEMRFHSIHQSQQILRKLINNENLSSQLKIRIMIEMCDNLLIEIKSLESLDAIAEIEVLLSNIEELATSQKLKPILLKMKLIRAKLSFIRDDIQNYSDYINQAEDLNHQIQSHYYSKLIDQVKSEYNTNILKATENYDKKVKYFQKTMINDYLNKVKDIIEF